METIEFGKNESIFLKKHARRTSGYEREKIFVRIFGATALLFYVLAVYLSAFSITLFLNQTTESVFFGANASSGAIALWSGGAIPICIIIFSLFSFFLAAGVLALGLRDWALTAARAAIFFHIFMAITFFVGSSGKFLVLIEDATVTIFSDIATWGSLATLVLNAVTLCLLQKYKSLRS